MIDDKLIENRFPIIKFAKSQPNNSDNITLAISGLKMISDKMSQYKITYMKQTLAGDINGRIDSYRDKAGKNPAHIILGKNKLIELKKLAKTQTWPRIELTGEEGRYSYKGYPIEIDPINANRVQVG